MEAKRDEPLPIILVSAKDEESAALLISELIDNEVENNDKECGRVWRLENKYYTASARVLGAGHARAPAPSLEPHVEAHVVYLTPDEVAAATAGAELVAARLARCAASVRAVAADCAHEPPALRAAALRARADLVPLRAPPPAAGLPRLRQVLHAHVWPGARMRRPAALTPAPPPPDDDDDDEWGEWTSAAGEGAAFAAALRALPAAAAHARSPAPREERLARAEQVLALFCNAIGAPLD